MMFELLLDVVDPFLDLRDTNAQFAIALWPSKLVVCPKISFFRWAVCRASKPRHPGAGSGPRDENVYESSGALQPIWEGSSATTDHL